MKENILPLIGADNADQDLKTCHFKTCHFFRICHSDPELGEGEESAFVSWVPVQVTSFRLARKMPA